MRTLAITIAMFCVRFIAAGQIPDTSIFRLPVVMDSVVVRAARGGWDVQAFIRRVQTDTTFYKAFRTLHLVSFNASNDVRILAKDGSVKAGMKNKAEQTRSKGC